MKNTTDFLLVKGSILFEEHIKVLEVYSVQKFESMNDADIAGSDYIDNGGDSYIVLPTSETIEWVNNSHHVLDGLVQTPSK